jgi:hypothetical protein
MLPSPVIGETGMLLHVQIDSIPPVGLLLRDTIKILIPRIFFRIWFKPENEIRGRGAFGNKKNSLLLKNLSLGGYKLSSKLQCHKMCKY